MPNDPRYHTRDWQTRRAWVLQRDGYRCRAPGCTARATVVDHIIPPAAGGTDDTRNLRSLCRRHDNMVKERPGGVKRGRDGEFPAACDVNGMPLDPNHPWFKG